MVIRGNLFHRSSTINKALRMARATTPPILVTPQDSPTQSHTTKPMLLHAIFTPMARPRRNMPLILNIQPKAHQLPLLAPTRHEYERTKLRAHERVSILSIGALPQFIIRKPKFERVFSTAVIECQLHESAFPAFSNLVLNVQPEFLIRLWFRYLLLCCWRVEKTYDQTWQEFRSSGEGADSDAVAVVESACVLYIVYQADTFHQRRLPCGGESRDFARGPLETNDIPLADFGEVFQPVGCWVVCANVSFELDSVSGGPHQSAGVENTSVYFANRAFVKPGKAGGGSALGNLILWLWSCWSEYVRKWSHVETNRWEI